MIKRGFIFMIILMLSLTSRAQCTQRNTAFNGGESLSYNLYYNWQLVWVKAGTASLNTDQTTYQNQSAYKTSLITRSNGTVDHLFTLRDTLLSYCSTGLAPLYYRKGAREGKRYYVDEVFYTYPDGICQARMHQQRNDGSHAWNTEKFDKCMYDMVNVFQRTRSLDPSNWEKGFTITFQVADGTKAIKGKLKFAGRVNVKADDGHKYTCLKLSYYEVTPKKDDNIADFFVTDDANHVPIRIDLHLKFGSAKAFMTSMKGLRNPIKSMIK